MADVSLVTSISNLATRVGEEAKTLHAKVGELESLNTTVKTSTVDAINELVAAMTDLSSSIINDEAASTDSTYSSEKIETVVQNASDALKSEILGGAEDAWDTLQDLKELIDQEGDVLKALWDMKDNYVAYTEAQELTDEQKKQARDNIGAAAAEDIDLSDFATKEELQEVFDALDSYKEEVGDFSDVDFVALFESALAGDSGDGNDGGDTEPDDQNP